MNSESLFGLALRLTPPSKGAPLEQIEPVSIAMSPAFIFGVSPNFTNAQIMFLSAFLS